MKGLREEDRREKVMVRERERIGEGRRGVKKSQYANVRSPFIIC